MSYTNWRILYFICWWGSESRCTSFNCLISCASVKHFAEIWRFFDVRYLGFSKIQILTAVMFCTYGQFASLCIGVMSGGTWGPEPLSPLEWGDGRTSHFIITPRAWSPTFQTKVTLLSLCQISCRVVWAGDVSTDRITQFLLPDMHLLPSLGVSPSEFRRGRLHHKTFIVMPKVLFAWSYS